jgi:hypothetical protein
VGGDPGGLGPRVSTRKVDDLVAAMGGCHVSKSEVSRICSELDLELALFRDRPLDDAQYPYVWFDATYEKVRQGGRIVSQAVAMAIRESGEKCVLGVAVGASETEAFWREFCRSLVARGLSGVLLVISDAHEGLRSAEISHPTILVTSRPSDAPVRAWANSTFSQDPAGEEKLGLRAGSTRRSRSCADAAKWSARW